MFSTLASLARLIRAAWTLARHDALLPREYQDKLPPGARLLGRLARLIANPRRAANPGARFARALEKLGPAYVKLGQFLSSRGDIVGAEFAEGLATLKDRMPAFPQRAAERAVETEFARPVAELFAEFGPAIAAASVAQVHRARTTEGREVAVKVLRPRIETRITRDVAAFRLGAKLVEAFAPPARRLDPRGFVETLARSLTLEMDLRLEAASAAEIDEIAARVDGFRAPGVDWDRSGKRVMTTEWVDGAPLSDAAAVDALGVDRKALGVTAIRAFLTCALDHGVFHADMHEGNLFAAPDGDLVAVDFGIMGRIGAAERRYLAEILHGFLVRDYARIARVHFEAGYVPEGHAVDDFAAALRAVGEPIFGKRASEVSMGRVLLQLFEVTELFDMRLRPELVLLQKTMVQVEGVARRLDPEHDIWEASRPVVERWMRRELGPQGLAADALTDARRLRAALKRLPAALEDLNAAAAAMTEGGLRLDDDTLARLARAQARATRMRTLGVWALALGVGALAAAGVAAALG